MKKGILFSAIATITIFAISCTPPQEQYEVALKNNYNDTVFYIGYNYAFLEDDMVTGKLSGKFSDGEYIPDTIAIAPNASLPIIVATCTEVKDLDYFKNFIQSIDTLGTIAFLDGKQKTYCKNKTNQKSPYTSLAYDSLTSNRFIFIIDQTDYTDAE